MPGMNSFSTPETKANRDRVKSLYHSYLDLHPILVIYSLTMVSLRVIVENIHSVRGVAGVGVGVTVQREWS